MSQRDKIKMSDAEIHDFLKNSRTMILVSNGKGGYPHPMPMWYTVDDDNTTYMTTFRKSQKVLNLKRDPKATLLVESGNAYEELKGVLLYTSAEIIDDLDTTIDTLFKISVARGDMGPDQFEAAKGPLSKNAAKRVTLRFTPERIVSWDHAKQQGGYRPAPPA